MGEFETKTTIYMYVKRFMFVSNQIRSLEHVILGFKLNRFMKKIN